MKSMYLILFGILLSAVSFAQPAEDEKLIQLAKAYKNYMFRNEPAKDFIKDLKADVPKGLKATTDFIVQTITTGNDILKQQYLALPDKQTLTYLNIIHYIYQNISDENQEDNSTVIGNLKKADTPENELADNYYSMLFTAVGNKLKPFDLSKINFELKNYNLKNESLKGIFFLQCMRYCGSEIWGYMNIVKPPNTKKAFDYIRKFPKFDGQPYYQFTDLYFPDFKIIISKEDDAPQSYKSYYLDKYYDVLLSHLVCVNTEGGTEKESQDLMLGSILKENKLYKYTKNKAVLEDLFKEFKE